MTTGTVNTNKSTTEEKPEKPVQKVQVEKVEDTEPKPYVDDSTEDGDELPF